MSKDDGIDPHYRVYIEARVGPYDSKGLKKNGPHIPSGLEIKHAASYVVIEHSNGKREVWKDKRGVTKTPVHRLEWSDAEIEVLDAFGHLSTGGERVVNEDLLRRARVLLDRCYRESTSETARMRDLVSKVRGTLAAYDRARASDDEDEEADEEED